MLTYPNVCDTLKTRLFYFLGNPGFAVGLEGWHVHNYRWTLLLSRSCLGSSNCQFGKPQQEIRMRKDIETGYLFSWFLLCDSLVCVLRWKIIAALKETDFKRLSLCNFSIPWSGPVGPVADASSDPLVSFLHYLLLFFHTAHNFKINNVCINFPWISLIWLRDLLVPRTLINWAINNSYLNVRPFYKRDSREWNLGYFIYNAWDFSSLSKFNWVCICFFSSWY